MSNAIAASWQERPLNLVCFDVENRPSAYWYDDKTSAEITAIGWKLLDEPDVHTMMLTPRGSFVLDGGRRVSARRAYLYFRGVLADAGIVYGHNIRSHDLPLVQAGLMRLRLPSLPMLLTTDTHRDLHRRKDMSVSLENLAAVYDLPGKKPRLAQREWEEANRLIPEGIEQAKERVTADVLLQEQLRLRLVEDKYLWPPRMWSP